MSKKEQISGIFLCLVFIGWIVLMTFLIVNTSNKNNKLEARIKELETVIDDESNQNQFSILKGKIIDYVIMPDAEIIPKIELEDGTIAYLPITNKAVKVGKEVYIIGLKDKYVFIEVENVKD